MAKPGSLNAPVAGYAPDAGDMRRQAAHDKMMAHIQMMVDEAPPPSNEQISQLRDLLSGPKPHPSRFRQWRVKLSCGHQLLTESLDDNPPHHAFACPACGAGDRIVVAFEPRDRSGGPGPDASTEPAPRPRRRTKAELQARVAELEAELARRDALDACG